VVEPNSPKRGGWRTVYKQLRKRPTADVIPVAKPEAHQAPATDIVPAAEDRIFGVPLNVSTRYANVAISLYDDKGQSYIYGYTPLVVAKCGVYVKDKGTWQ